MSGQTTVKSAPAVGLPGTPSDFATSDGEGTVSGTSEEASAEIPRGLVVQVSTTNSDYGAKLITGTTNKLFGIVMRSDDMSDSDLGSTGYKPGATFPVGRKGRFFVTIEENVTPTSSVRIRCAGTGTIGAFRATADATNCLDCTPFAKWVRTSAAADGVGEVEIDFTNAALAVAG
jgi:hypothetical protein